MAKNDLLLHEQSVTADLIRSKKGRQRITFVTAYDFPTAKLADEAGFDLILVGDTLAEVVLGHETTLPVTFEGMLHHTCAVRRAIKRALLVADLPYGTYHVSEEDALRCAVRFVKEGGAQAVKLEGGGQNRARLIRRMVDAEIPMMGHIGLTPQSVHRMGGYKVQGRIVSQIERLIEDAMALDKAGVFAIVLEGMPREVAKIITEQVSVPTLGIGAGPDCDGQVLVLNDLVGLTFKRPAKFVRQYMKGAAEIATALARFKVDVEAVRYPGDGESYHLPAELRLGLPAILRRMKNSESNRTGQGFPAP
jgi:3-methyl-2-oxobutanoate hydroxymethyltransferase